MNPVKKVLSDGGTAWGASTLGPTPLIAKLTATTGVDFVWIDTEHSSFGTESIELLPPLIRQSGAMPLVRVAGTDAVLIKKALDIGAQGIMAPQVEDAAEAGRIVEYAKYPPMGSRGVSPMWTFYNDVAWGEYLPVANEESLIVAQVETVRGMENVEAIAAVEGIDVVLAGPMDLSAAMGLIGQTQHERVQAFLEEFPARVRSQGKVAGIALGSVEAAEKAWKQGYRFINFANAVFDGLSGIKRGLAHLKALALAQDGHK